MAILISTAMKAADTLIAALKDKSPRRCETCKFWGSPPNWFAPTGWKKCTEEQQDTSPLYLCGRYRSNSDETAVNGVVAKPIPKRCA